MSELPLEIDRFLSTKRFHKADLKRKRQRLEKMRTKAESDFQLGRFGRESKIIELLSQHALSKLPAKRYKMTVRVPKTFSIIDRPKDAISLITSFAAGIKNSPKKIQEICFDHSRMTSCDLAANALLDVVALEYSAKRKIRKARNTRTKLKTKGLDPVDQGLTRLIRAIGIIKHLNVKHEAPSPSEAKKLEVFYKHNRHYTIPSANHADKKSNVSARFVEHIDNCIKSNNRMLSNRGRHNLSCYLGEILANAEEHSETSDWSVLGYLDSSLSIPRCEIAIFNFGKSISESLSSLPENSYTYLQIKHYLDSHSKQGFFTTMWRREDLLTIIALQSHISRMNRSERDTRGQGTVDLIEFFQQVQRECNAEDCHSITKMAIVSGGTYILFDGSYRMKEMDGKKIIAFNQQNQLSSPPDSRVVQSLDGLFFPGTIISIMFPLSFTDSTLLQEATHNGRTDDH